MKIAIVGHGSRGDAQPPLTLAARLLDAGHDVTVCLPGDFGDVVGRLGCRSHVLPFEVRRELDVPELRALLRSGQTLRFFRAAFEHQLPIVQAMNQAVLEGTEGADLIVGSGLLEDLCLTVAEARGQRVTFAFPSPIWWNVSYPSLLFGGMWIPRWLYPLSHAITELGVHRLLPMVNELRARLGLPQVSRRPSLSFRKLRPPVFYWLPPQVVPPPADYAPHHHFTGYWSPTPRLRAALGEATPPAALVRFVEAGPPPIYVGFGSMPVLDEPTIELVLGVARALGRRVVFGVGWSPPAAAHPDACFVDAVDHDWLFPRCAAIVHHGGASTTGAALRSGVPALVVSVFADQPFWGQRVHALGVGETIPFQRLTTSRLRAALTRVLSPATRARARMFGAELASAPDGAEVTARFIHARTNEFPIPVA